MCIIYGFKYSSYTQLCGTLRCWWLFRQVSTLVPPWRDQSSRGIMSHYHNTTYGRDLCHILVNEKVHVFLCSWRLKASLFSHFVKMPYAISGLILDIEWDLSHRSLKSCNMSPLQWKRKSHHQPPAGPKYVAHLTGIFQDCTLSMTHLIASNFYGSISSLCFCHLDFVWF